MIKKCKFLQNAKQEFVNTNFKQLEPKKINSFFKDNYCSKIWNYVKLIIKSLNEMEELKKFQRSTFDTIARRRLVEDQDTILELAGKIQDLQNEINRMNDSKEFQDAESIRSGVIPTSSNT